MLRGCATNLTTGVVPCQLTALKMDTAGELFCPQRGYAAEELLLQMRAPSEPPLRADEAMAVAMREKENQYPLIACV